MDGTVVVTEIGHGVETVAHHLGGNAEYAILGTAEISEHTGLETFQIGLGLNNLFRIIRNCVVGHQVQVAGSHRCYGSAKSKDIEYLFHIRSVL